MKISALDALRTARVQKAKDRRYHKRCATCRGPRTICTACGNVICKACRDHVCKYAATPSLKTVLIPEPLRPLLTALALTPLTVEAIVTTPHYKLTYAPIPGFAKEFDYMTSAPVKRALTEHGWKRFSGLIAATHWASELHRVAS